MSSAKRLPGVPWDAARNKAQAMGLIAGDDKYPQRENLKSRLGFLGLSKEKLALAEYNIHKIVRIQTIWTFIDNQDQSSLILISGAI